jgi:hypothetical protein
MGDPLGRGPGYPARATLADKTAKSSLGSGIGFENRLIPGECCLQKCKEFTAETQSAQRGQGASPATRPARLDRDRDLNRNRKDMTSGREKPDVCWADICWTLPSKNMRHFILVE